MNARILKLVFVTVVAVGASLACFFAFLHIADDTVLEAPRQAVSAPFNGDLLAVSDVDQVATAYGDGIRNRRHWIGKARLCKGSIGLRRAEVIT